MQHRSHPWRGARRSPHRYRATHQRREQPRRSWDQDQFASGLTALHVGMRFRCVRQPIVAAEKNLKFSHRNPIEELRRARAKQFGRMDKVAERRIADLNAFRQRHDVEWSRTSKNRDIPAERARPAQHVERSLKGRRPGAVIDDMEAWARGRTEGLVGEPTLGMDNHMISAGLLGHGDLLLRGDTPDDMTASQLDDLGQQQSHATRRRVDEGDVAGLHRIEVGREVAGGQPLHHHRRRRAVVDRVGNLHQGRGRDGDPLCITAGHVNPGDAPTGFDIFDTISHRKDTAHSLDAQNHRLGNVGPKHATAHTDIHEVDAGNGNLDQCLTWTRHRIGALDIIQCLASAGAVHHDCFHRLAPMLNDRFIIGQKKESYYRNALSVISARPNKVAWSSPPRPATRMAAMFAIKNSAIALESRSAEPSPSRCAQRTRSAMAPRKFVASNALIWGLPIVGTKTWNSLLNQPIESLGEALCLDRKKQFQEEYHSQKVGRAAFLSQFKQNWLPFPSYSKFWFQLWANPNIRLRLFLALVAQSAL